jgi:hypothetical protein
LFCGNARIAAIMEILSGFPQLLGKAKKQLFHIPTKPIIFS